MSIIDWFTNLKNTRPILFWILATILIVIGTIGTALTLGGGIVFAILVARYYKSRSTFIEDGDFIIQTEYGPGSVGEGKDKKDFDKILTYRTNPEGNPIKKEYFYGDALVYTYPY